MGIRRGDATPTKFYRGTTQVKKVMRGTVQVWAASAYPMSGAWGPSQVQYPPAPFHTHQMTEAGTFTITLTSNSPGAVVAGVLGPWGESIGNTPSGGSPSTVTTTRTLAVGDSVYFMLIAPPPTPYFNATASWTITKN